MITLKESILSRSNHTGEGFKAQRRNEIEKWLKEHYIESYTINDDFTIDVDGSVYLAYSHLHEFPEYIQFGVVKGAFNCSYNQLTSLKGAPKKVDGNFNCTYNELISLEDAPIIVRGDFVCNHNRLTTLKGAPKSVGGSFECYHNHTQFTEDDVRKVCKVWIRILV